jgi:hypothetical protein
MIGDKKRYSFVFKRKDQENFFFFFLAIEAYT